MTDNDQPDWQKQAGLSTETTSARIYPTQKQKTRWEEDAGNQSLSKYIIEKVEQSRQNQNPQHHSTDS